VLIFYLKELLVPRLSEMSLFLDDFPIFTHFNGIVLGALAFHALIWGLVWKSWKKYPLICFGIAWFYASHTLESTVLPLELAFEHRNYLASMGIFIVLADIWFRALKKVDIKLRVKQALLGVWLVLLAHLTYLRVMGWENLGVFLSLSVDEHPKSARAHVFWANYLLEHGLREQSFQELTLARKLAPRNSGMIIHKLLFYCDSPIPHALIQELEESLTHEVLTAYSISALDTLITRALKGSCPAVSPALLVHLFQLATQNPNIQYQKNWLSSLYQYRAYAYFLNKEYDNGMQCLDKSFELYPKRITPLLNKAEYQIMNHRLQEAEQTLSFIRQKLKQRPYAFSDYIPLIEEKLEKAKKGKNVS
jgi:tetratricopeptide (TPR) repeat protein